VDRLCASGRRAARALPRDLAPETLAAIRDAIRQHGGSAAEIAARSGVARVTARRYLEYLAASGELTTGSSGSGPGRPTKTYVRNSSALA
jgi:two-component system CitB family response regulator